MSYLQTFSESDILDFSATGFAHELDKWSKAFTEYFETGEMPLSITRDMMYLQDAVDNRPEELDKILYNAIHHSQNGRKSVGYDILNAIQRFEIALFGKPCSDIEQEEYVKTLEKFDFIPNLIIEYTKEVTELEKMLNPRISSAVSHVSALEEKADMFHLCNYHQYDYMEIDDIEAEYDFHMKRMFSDLDQMHRMLTHLMKHRDLIVAANNCTMEGMMETLGSIEYSINLYLHDETPAEAWRENFMKNMSESKEDHPYLCLYYGRKLWSWERDALQPVFEKSINLLMEKITERPITNTEEDSHFQKNEVSQLVRQAVDEVYPDLHKADSGDMAEETSDSNKGKDTELATENGGANHMASVKNSHHFTRTFFSMPHIHLLHEMCNGRQFEEVSPGELYQIFNLLDMPKKLAALKGEKKRICHLLYFLGEMIPKQHRVRWRREMQKVFDITERTFKSKSTSKSSTVDDSFAKAIGELKEKYRELEGA